MPTACRLLAVALIACLAGCASRSAPPPRGAPADAGKTARPGVLATREGLASFYGAGFHGRTTASGVTFDMHAAVAAHPTYPFQTLVRVTNLKNGRSTQVVIVDRGPAAGPRARGVIIDLSRGAAEALDFVREGRTRVRVDVLRWGSR